MLGYDVIIAHGPNCNDGSTAAWAFWKKLPDDYKQKLAKYGGFYSDDKLPEVTGPYIHPNSFEGALKLQQLGLPLVFAFSQPGMEVPTELIKDKRVLILDLDMSDALVAVVRDAKFVMLCDHHESTPLTINKYAKFLLEECKHKFATYVVTEKKESGATLAWRLSNTSDIPPFVQVVRIGDTWCWDEYKDLHPKEVLCGIKINKGFSSFQQIDKTFNTWDVMFPIYLQQGKAALDYESCLIKQACQQCSLGYIKDKSGRTYTVAYVQSNVLISEIGAAMKWYAKKKFKKEIDFCAVWKYIPHKDIITISLRDPGPNIDLSIISRNIEGCKGGGHKQSAGFVFEGLVNFHKYIMNSE